MRRTVLATVLVLAMAVAPAVPASAQTTSGTKVDLDFTLNPEDGTVDVRFEVDDPGSLATIQLALGRLNSLVGEAELEGAWKREGDLAVADLEETPNPVAKWTADARIRVQSLEGEGHTSYVGSEFAVIKAGDVVPAVRYTFPQDRKPSFTTLFSVKTPEGWEVAGPWTSTGSKSYEIDGLIPRGFLAADDELATETLGNDEVTYRIARVGGADTHRTMEKVLLGAGDFLTGIYGPTKHQRFVVVAPNPMFRGGLGSPDGVFLHADADGGVIAHEMAHAFQGFDFSRESGKATIWLAEGAAVVHGTLLEVATDLKTREEALDHMRDQARTAREKHAVDLTTAIYGTPNERAAYTKGAVVVTALDDMIRESTSNQYTLADVLKEINERSRAKAPAQLKLNTTDFRQIIGDVTGFDLSAFFQKFVHGSDVPELGALFPGQAAVRILSTEPSPAVADEPFQVRVQLTNLDTDRLDLQLPVLVDGSEAGTLTASLEPGASAVAEATVSAQPKGTYDLQVQDSLRELTVVGPPKPAFQATIWPTEPGPQENVTVGAGIVNRGEAPYRGPIRLVVDGETVAEQAEPVPSGEKRTITRTLPPLGPGEHSVAVVAPNGSVVDQLDLTIGEPTPPAQAPAVGGVLALSLLAVASLLARARRRR